MQRVKSPHWDCLDRGKKKKYKTLKALKSGGHSFPPLKMFSCHSFSVNLTHLGCLKIAISEKVCGWQGRCPPHPHLWVAMLAIPHRPLQKPGSIETSRSHEAHSEMVRRMPAEQREGRDSQKCVPALRTSLYTQRTLIGKVQLSVFFHSSWELSTDRETAGGESGMR